MPKLLLVGIGRMGRPYVAAARRLGLRVCAVELEERAATVADEVDDLVVCRGTSDELWAEAAAAAARTRRPDGVVAFSEPQVVAAALVQDELGLPGPSLRAATLSRNKALQRAVFAAAGIAQPEYLVSNRLGDAREWATTRMPVVVKPLSSAGSEGVELVPDTEAFKDAVARRGNEGRLLVEQALTGPEYSWEALVRGGEIWFANVTAKETTGPPQFVEIAHRTIADLDDGTEKLVGEVGAGVLEAIGMRDGIVHLEFRATPTELAVMEVAVRTPGDYLMDLLGLTYGVDWFELVVRVAMGWELPEPPEGPTGYAASYFPVASPGTVVGVHGLADVKAQGCVVNADVSVSAGEVVLPARSSNDRVGHVVLSSDNRADLEAALEEVRRTLVVVTEPA